VGGKVSSLAALTADILRRMTEMTELPFWKTLTLEQMSLEQWESLCDRCGKCCLFKIEDADTGELYFTNIVCRLLDLNTCGCSQYETRRTLVPDCVNLYQHGDIQKLNFMPTTCAYRLLAEGKDLPHWHPLVTGERNSAMAAGHCVKGRVFVENDDLVLEDYIVDWPR
jgi:uncharacterized cysteine cluster protein YcgN (CxxCxxCC family)